MLIWIIILSILSLIMTTLAIIAFIGMFRGMKKYEYHESVIRDVRQKILETYIIMKEVDTLGAFEADDEVGITFKELYRLVTELNNYTDERTNLENQ